VIALLNIVLQILTDLAGIVHGEVPTQHQDFRGQGRRAAGPREVTSNAGWNRGESIRSTASHSRCSHDSSIGTTLWW